MDTGIENKDNKENKANKDEIKSKPGESDYDIGIKKLNPEKYTLNPDAWGRLIGPHNVANIELDGNKIVALLDTGCQITNISRKYCEEMNIPVLDIDKLVDLEQADGSNIDYEGYAEITIECDLFPSMKLDIPVLVVPYTSYHDQVPLTIGTKTLGQMIDLKHLQNDIDLPTSWKYAYHSILISRELEKTPDKPLSKLKASRNIVVPAFSAVNVPGVTKSKGIGLKVHIVVEGNPASKLPEGVCVHPAYTYLKPGVNKTHARVVNFTARDQIIPKNTCFGLAFMGNKVPDIIAPGLQGEKLKPVSIEEINKNGCSNKSTEPIHSPKTSNLSLKNSTTKENNKANKINKVNKKVTNVGKHPERNKSEYRNKKSGLNKENKVNKEHDDGSWVLEKLDLSGMAEWSPEVQIKAKALLCEYHDIFSRHDLDLGKTHLVKHDIQLTDHKPFKQNYRRIPPHLYDEVKKHLKEMLDLGAIRKSQSPWSSAIVLVQKKDGTLRFCIDLRELNNRTVKDNYSLPKIDHHLEQLIGAAWFTTLDLKSGYWQVELTEQCKPYTAFTCGPLGFYECNLMPFGASNAPATFQRLMENCLGDLNLKWCVVYLDDIIIFAKTPEEHLERLRSVFNKLREANLKLKPSKCNFFRREITYLGHLVSSQGISCDPKKIESVRNWPVPTTINEIRSFLGFVGYYRRFIKSFSKIARPLNDLLVGHESCKKKMGNKKINWSEVEQCAFQDLKDACCSAPVLAYADFTKPFILHTDSSLDGLGAVLYQKDPEDKLRVIAYASRSLSKSEKNYPAHKLEFLAMKWAITDKFKEYLYGAPFEVFTDNNPLTYINTSAKLDATTQRWVACLASFTFDIFYRAGKHNIDADALSRIKWPEDSNDVLSNRKVCVKINSEVIKAIMQGHGNKGGYIELVNMSMKVYPSEWLRTETETSEMNKDDWVLEQNKDVHIQYLKDKIKENKLKHGKINKMEEECTGISYYLRYKNQYKLVDNLLYRKVYTNTGKNSFLLQLVLPKHFVDRALIGCHDQVGHVGRDKTVELLKERFFWPTLYKDTVNYISNCRRCLSRKAVSQKAELCPIQASKPMEVVHVDFLTLEPSKGNIENVLVITDHFTRYAQAYASKTQTAQTTAKLLWENFICHYGFPEKLLSDQGRNFESALIKDLCKLAGVSKIRTTPYHPQTNGQCERFNRTLLNMLGTMSDEDKLDWKTHLSTLTHAYNCTRNSATNYSPYYLMFGRHPRLAVDVEFGLYRDGQHVGFSKSKYVEKLQRKLQYAFKQAESFAAKVADRNKVRYDKKAKEYQLEVGDVVLVKIVAHKTKHKIQNKWEELEYVVVEQPDVSIPVYVVQPITGGKKRTLHRNLLYPLGFKESVDCDVEDSEDEEMVIPIGLFEATEKDAGIDNSVDKSNLAKTPLAEENLSLKNEYNEVPLDVVDPNSLVVSLKDDSSADSSLSGFDPVVDLNSSKLGLVEDSDKSDELPTQSTGIDDSNLTELLEQSDSLASVETEGDLTKLLEAEDVKNNSDDEKSPVVVPPRRSTRSNRGLPPPRYGEVYTHRIGRYPKESVPALVRTMRTMAFALMLVKHKRK